MMEKERVKQLARDKAGSIIVELERKLAVVAGADSKARAEALRKTYAKKIIYALCGIGGAGDDEFKKAFADADDAKRQEMGDAVKELLIMLYPILDTEGVAETHATNIIGQMADAEIGDKRDKEQQIEVENIDVSELESQLSEIKIKLNGQFGELISLFEKIIRLLKAYPVNRPQNVEQRINSIVVQIKIDKLEMIENDAGDYADDLEDILNKIKKLVGLSSTTNSTTQENSQSIDSKYEFVDPSRDDLSAYVAEWKRLWDLSEKEGRLDKFIEFVDDVLIRMESEINDFMDRAKFSEKPVGIRYKALKTFFNNMGYSFNKDSGEFSGKVAELKALYTYLHNRLSLADHFHLNGVSSSMYANFEESVRNTFPEFGRYVTDYFLGTAVDASKRKEKTEVYEHYRLVRVFDHLMTGYYDEMTDGFEQDRDSNGRFKTDSSGNPEFVKYRTIYVVRKNGEIIVENGRAVEGTNFSQLKKKYSGEGFSVEEKYPALYAVKKGGAVIATGVNKQDLWLRYPNADGIAETSGTLYFVYDSNGNIVDGGDDKSDLEMKYTGNDFLISSASSLSEEKQQRGYFSFGRARWSSSGGGFKTAMITRLKADFAALPGVKRSVKSGEVVYSYTGPEASKSSGKVLEISESKLEESIGIAIGINAMSATRAEIFTGLYYAIGKSPNDDVNLELMSKCFPLSKELNLTKESVLEIPYIVLGGDVPNYWLAEGALRIGLCRMILSNPELRNKTGIHSQEDFFKETIYTVDGVQMKDIRGLVALRELDASLMTNVSLKDGSLTTDFPRFRSILRSIYISRLKRDLLRLRFSKSSAKTVSDQRSSDEFGVVMSKSDSKDSEFRTMDIFAHKRTPAYVHGLAISGRLIRPFVMPPRMIMVEVDENLDLSKPDSSKPGQTAEDGLQFHSNILAEYEAATKTYEIANQALPTLSGEISKDVEIIVKDLEGLLKQTSLMKKDDKMIDWVYFYELMQMRITRLIFLHREKYSIFQRRLIEPGERILGKPVASSTVIHEIRHYIENSGQTGVGGDALIYVPQYGRKVNLKIALLSLIPDEDIHHGENRKESLGSFMGNIRALFTAEGYNKNSLIGEKRVGMYAGGIQQRSMLLEVQGSAYVNALKRYQLISFLDPDTAVLTNTGMLHSGSAAVKSAKESQEKEKEKK